MSPNHYVYKSNKIPFCLCLICALIRLSATVSATEENRTIQTTGYLKHFFLLQVPAEINGLPESIDQPAAEGIVLNRCRLKLTWAPADSVVGEIAYDLIPQVSENRLTSLGLLLPRPQPRSYRAEDFREGIYLGKKVRDGNFSLGHNLDRLYVVFSPAIADFTLGRQPIAFGAARAVNPTDVFSPFVFQDLDKEERVGVDAWRVKVPLGSMGEVDAGMVFGEDFQWQDSAAFLRTRHYFLETDLTFICLVFKENLLGGLDLTRAIGGAGFWLEAAYTFADLVNDPRPEEDFFRLSIGIDYNFGSGIYGYLEYHFNGAGRNDPGDYLAQLEKTAYQEGGVYLLGSHYLIPGFRCEITPLWIFSEQMLLNLADGSLYLSAQLEYSLAQDVFIQAGLFSSLGKRARFDVSNGQGLEAFQAESEFGLYPAMYYASVRLYF